MAKTDTTRMTPVNQPPQYKRCAQCGNSITGQLISSYETYFCSEECKVAFAAPIVPEEKLPANALQAAQMFADAQRALNSIRECVIETNAQLVTLQQQQ